AQSEITPTVQASIGASSQVLVGQGITVDAASHEEASATLFQVVAGGIAASVSLADATMSPTVKAYIDSGAHVTATNGAIMVQAMHDTVNGAQVSGQAAAGSLASGVGAHFTATAAAVVNSHIGSNAEVHAGGTVSVLANGGNSATADANTLSVG